ncbi:Adaptor protein complex 3 subunit delta, partial [Guillardia theta CCMP2712]
MFEKTLSDLVKGLRSNKRREAEYVSKCIAEIKEELQSKDKSHTVKANAVVKLAYLQMLGYDMQWASFHIVEVMSSPGFAQKRLGYLGASVSFNDETEVVLLCTNMFKKDFQDASPFVVGLAINCLANICTTDLARDLVADVVQLMNSNRAYVRKKAVLVMYKIFLKFPDALRPSFPKLKEKLEDRDTSTVSCAVNVICELARKNPQNYLALAPIFFKLLTHTANNWMLIKIVKLLGALCPLEPRLGKKLVEPLTNLINTTPAKSLLYEAIHTVSVGMTPHLEIVQLSMEKLKDFVEDEDQNLKYLGLLAMGNFMKVHPRIVAEHKTMILKCLNDEDITIRHRALDLVSGMVTKKNLQDIVRILMEHVDNSEGSFRHDLVDKIIEVSSANGYAAVTNFEWYITTLCKLARVPGVCNGLNLKNQLMDVIIRVRAVREFGVAAMVDILRDIDMLSQCSRDPTSAEVMYAAAWLVGEFSDLLEDSKRAGVMDSLLSKRVMCLPEHVQSVYLHSALKIYVSSDLPPMQQAPQVAEAAAVPSGAVQARPANVPSAQLYNILDERLPAFEKSTLLEVQERACICHHLLELVKEAESLGSETILQSQFESMFLDELKPVAPKAQSKVPVPEGLDLDARIHDVELEDEPTEDESEHSANEQDEDSDGEKKKKKKKEKSSGWTEKERKKRITDPFYLGAKTASEEQAVLLDAQEVEAIPIFHLSDDEEGGKKKKRKSKKKKNDSDEDDGQDEPSTPNSSNAPLVHMGYEMPDADGDDEDANEDAGASRDELAAKLNVDLSKPLKASEKSKDHSSKRKDETESEEESEEEDKKSKKDKKKDSGKKDKKKKDKKEKSDKKSSKKDRESPREDQCPRLIPRSLGSDKMIKATYEAKAALDSNAKVPPVIVTVTLTNTGDFTLQPVSINVTTSMNVRLSTPPNELQLLGPGSSAEIRMELVVASVGKPHKVKCSIKYEATGEGAPAAPITVPCEMLLPCSSFLVARAMTHDEFNSLIGSNSTPHKSSAVIEAGGRPFKHSLHLLASLLNLRVVHSMDGAACLYAMSVLGHHVAVLAKAKGGSMVSVDMRCSDEALCQQLCNEV